MCPEAPLISGISTKPCSHSPCISNTPAAPGVCGRTTLPVRVAPGPGAPTGPAAPRAHSRQASWWLLKKWLLLRRKLCSSYIVQCLPRSFLQAAAASGTAALPPPGPAGASSAATAGGAPARRPRNTSWPGAAAALPSRQPWLRGQRICRPPWPQPLGRVLLAHQAGPGGSCGGRPRPARGAGREWRAAGGDAARHALHLLQVSCWRRGSNNFRRAGVGWARGEPTFSRRAAGQLHP